MWLSRYTDGFWTSRLKHAVAYATAKFDFSFCLSNLRDRNDIPFSVTSCYSLQSCEYANRADLDGRMMHLAGFDRATV